MCKTKNNIFKKTYYTINNNIVYCIMPPKFKKTYNATNYKPKTPYKTNVFKKENATWLIIVESPSKCSKIEHFLGENYKCIASKGHIRTIEGLKSIDKKNNFHPSFSIIPEKKEHVDNMKKVIEQFSKDKIIIATDDDREGEAIGWHICDIFELSIETTQRIIFHEITQSAVIKAVENPMNINMNIVRAQNARQVLDIIVGFNISPILWKYMFNDKDNSLSAGRCQTPALRLVYDNEMEKKENIVDRSYKTIANFFSKNLPFELCKEFQNREQVLDFLNKSIDFKHKLSIGSPKSTHKSPPKPFNTSNLLQTASNILHLSPKETMSYCQILYQNGHITYMRTENTKYSKSFLNDAEQWIKTKWSDSYVGDFSKIENLDENNPHEAIRVTHIDEIEISEENTKVLALYKLIWKNTIESCMSEAKYITYEIQISAPNDLHYKYNIEIPVFIGWKKVTEKLEKHLETDQQNSANGLLLFLQSISNSMIKYNKIECSLTFHNKHSHYTEASLVKKLEDCGIGRPSTFALLVETIQTRGYVKKLNIDGEKIQCTEFKLEENKIQEFSKEKIIGNEKNKLYIQPIGNLIIEFLIKYFETLFSYNYTKQMEEKLDLISEGNNGTNELCKECHNSIKEMIKSMGNVSKESYIIDENHTFIFGKYGPTIKHTFTDGTIDYKSVNSDLKLDLEKLKLGKYKLEELLQKSNLFICEWNGEQVFTKTGKYGNYLEYGDNKTSIKDINKPIDQITFEDIKPILQKKDAEKNTQQNGEKEQSVLRFLNDDFCIRKGKFGAYVFYKTKCMQKPQFLNIKKFKEGYLNCKEETLIEWLVDTYNLNR